MQDTRKRAVWLLRCGLAFVFFYVAVSGFFSPFLWYAFFPVWMTEKIAAHTLLNIFGVFQLALALWLLSGKKAWYAAGAASFVLLGIILPNLSGMDIIFRDIGLLFAAFALWILERKQEV